MKLTIIKTTFQSGRAEYYLKESPPIEPFEKIIKEEERVTEVQFR